MMINKFKLVQINSDKIYSIIIKTNINNILNNKKFSPNNCLMKTSIMILLNNFMIFKYNQSKIKI